MQTPREGGDDVRLAEVGDHTGPVAEPIDEGSDAIERCREVLDRGNTPEQTGVSLPHVGHRPAANQSPELTEPSRTAVRPTTD